MGYGQWDSSKAKEGQAMGSDRDEGDKGGGVNTAPAYPLFIIPCIPFIPVKAFLFVCLAGMRGDGIGISLRDSPKPRPDLLLVIQASDRRVSQRKTGFGFHYSSSPLVGEDRGEGDILPPSP